jgi:RNA polymerase sigma factor (sigma-70 family)
MRAWRKRADFEWRGLPSFRRWLLAIAENCIWDARDGALTLKRGGAGELALATEHTSVDGRRGVPVFASTTPSRIALHREQSLVMRQALAELADDLREIVRLRLFDELSSEEVAERLNLTVAVVKHRLRKGTLAYRRRLEVLLSVRDRSSANA